MKICEITFWLCLFIVFYTYVGYGIFLYLFVKIKEAFRKTIQAVSRIAAKVVLLFQKYFNGAKKLKEAVSKLSVSEGGVLDASTQREVVNKLAAMEFLSENGLVFDDSFGKTLGSTDDLLKKIGKNDIKLK